MLLDAAPNNRREENEWLLVDVMLEFGDRLKVRNTLRQPIPSAEFFHSYEYVMVDQSTFLSAK